MVSKFIFIHCSNIVTADTPIYEVAVGDNARDARDISFLLDLTQNSDFYCQKYDIEVREFLTRITQSVAGDASKVGEIPPRHLLRVSDMRRHVLTQLLGFKPGQRPSRLAISQRLHKLSLIK